MSDNNNKQKRALGRGLSALMGDFQLDDASDATKSTARTNSSTLPVTQLRPGRFQPRRHFDDAALEELSESISNNGLLQPIIVRHLEASSYEIIAGERRWRASKAAGLNEVPVIIYDLDDKQALAVALLENIQRENLSPIEEAEGYQRLMKEFEYTQEVLARELGKSRSHVANLLRLLTLPEDVKKRIAIGDLSMGHAGALIGKDDAAELAAHIIEKRLSVRQAEKLAKGWGSRKNKNSTPAPSTPSANDTQFVSFHAASNAQVQEKDPDILVLETTLTEQIGVRVEIEEAVSDAGGSGRVALYFDTLEELDRIFQHLQKREVERTPRIRPLSL